MSFYKILLKKTYTECVEQTGDRIGLKQYFTYCRFIPRLSALNTAFNNAGT